MAKPDSFVPHGERELKAEVPAMFLLYLALVTGTLEVNHNKALLQIKVYPLGLGRWSNALTLEALHVCLLLSFFTCLAELLRAWLDMQTSVHFTAGWHREHGIS